MANKLRLRFKVRTGKTAEVKEVKLSSVEIERYLRMRGTIASLYRRMRSYCLSGKNIEERKKRFEEVEGKIRMLLLEQGAMCGCTNDSECDDDEVCIAGVCVPV